MMLEAQCPRCPAPVTVTGSEVSCPTHERVVPLWRAAEPSYESFAEHLVLSRPLPTWLPWPLPDGWQVSDYGCVGVEGGTPEAVVASCAGSSALDGPVELTVVTEEPGVGLGARVGDVAHSDPGAEVGRGPAALRLRVEDVSLPLWTVSTAEDGEALDRAVLAGEAAGRWLWVVVRPASALLLLRHVGPLTDLSGLGPPLVDTPFGAVPRSW
jgi:hypothetical protein